MLIPQSLSDAGTTGSTANQSIKGFVPGSGTTVSSSNPTGYGSYPVVTAAKVREVTFSEADLIAIVADPGTPTYPNPPHWLDTDLDGITNEDVDSPNDRALPVGYPRDTNSVVSAKFAATTMNWPYPPSNYSLMVRGFNTLSAVQPYYYNVPATPVSLVGNDVVLPPTLVNNPFPGYVNYGTLAITWEFSNNGGQSWSSAGRSENELYVTLATPSTSPVYHTLIHLSVPISAQVAANNDDILLRQT